MASKNGLDIIKHVPHRYRMDSNETGAVFWEDQLWFMGRTVEQMPVKRRIFSPETGEERIVKGTDHCYHVDVDIEIERICEREQIDTDDMEDEAGYRQSGIEAFTLEPATKPLGDIERDTFMVDGRVYAVSNREHDDGIECYNLLDGIKTVMTSDTDVQPVEVTMRLETQLFQTRYKLGRDNGKGWENS